MENELELETEAEEEGLKDFEDSEESQDDPKPDPKRDLLNEVRSLLKQYPLKIEFRGFTNEKELISNVILIYDLLSFCRFKTIKPEIRKLIEDEQRVLEQIDISALRHYYFLINGGAHFARHRSLHKALGIIQPHLSAITEKIQYYSLAIPFKDKGSMHLRTAQGLPAASADEFEADEIAEGEGIQEGEPFKIEEGKVVRVGG